VAISSDTAREGDAAMTEAPTKPPCWPGDPDYLDGFTEIFLPSEKYLKAYWDADILDDDKNKQDTIIESNEAFQVRFRVELKGRLWKCISGHWCFDVCFSSIGDGTDFDLSDVLPDALKPELRLCDWDGCETRCIDITITVPPGTIPAGYCGTLYEVGAKFELRCCGDCDCKDKEHGHLAVAGHEPEGEYMFV
jgi:hypothetical protein